MWASPEQVMSIISSFYLSRLFGNWSLELPSTQLRLRSGMFVSRPPGPASLGRLDDLRTVVGSHSVPPGDRNRTALRAPKPNAVRQSLHPSNAHHRTGPRGAAG